MFTDYIGLTQENSAKRSAQLGNESTQHFSKVSLRHHPAEFQL